MRDLQLVNKVAIVTGASRGIGEAIARELSLRGARLVLVARSEDALREVTKSLGRSHIYVPCDVADPKCAMDAVRSAVDTFGSIDILVNNAGAGHSCFFIECSDESIWKVLLTNLIGPINFMKAALPHMVKSGSGSIVNVASLAARTPLPRFSIYSASKAALAALSNALWLELRKYGIKVSCVYPAFVVGSGFFNAAGARPSRMPRLLTVTPKDVANAVIEGILTGKRFISVPKWAGNVARLFALFDSLYSRLN